MMMKDMSESFCINVILCRTTQLSNLYTNTPIHYIKQIALVRLKRRRCLQKPFPTPTLRYDSHFSAPKRSSLYTPPTRFCIVPPKKPVPTIEPARAIKSNQTDVYKNRRQILYTSDSIDCPVKFVDPVAVFAHVRGCIPFYRRMAVDNFIIRAYANENRQNKQESNWFCFSNAPATFHDLYFTFFNFRKSGFIFFVDAMLIGINKCGCW